MKNPHERVAERGLAEGCCEQTFRPLPVTREPSALVDDTLAVREGHVSPYVTFTDAD